MQDYQTNPAGQLQSALPCISMETIEELTRRDLLQVGDDYWRFGDESNGVTRKLNQRQKWMRGDNEGPAWHRLIGLDDVIAHDREFVLLAIEGSKDALAAADFAHCIGALPETGVMCALGSGYRPIPPEMHKLAGRWVYVIGDNDVAGIETTQLTSYALNQAGVEHDVWDWTKCEIRAKDFFDFWVEAKEKGEMKNAFVRLYSGTFFSPSVPSYNSPIQPFNPSTTQTAGVGDEEKLGIICPFIVTKRGTGNSMRFGLARAIKTRNMNMNDINGIHRLWFAKSRPLLPPDANEGESLEKFYDQLQRVRFTDAALAAACERANKAKPPFIPARDGDEELAKLAALHRELQRNAGSRPYICPVNVVQAFLHLRWPSQANYLNHVLENEKVIACVERGAPNKVGVKGKPTMWRYKLPLDQ